MKTANGLTVPNGYGSSAPPQEAGRSGGGRTARSAPKRTLPAGQLTDGMRVRGTTTLDTYEVLHATEAEDKRLLTLTVMNLRTHEVRYWSRRPDFRMELA